MIQICPAILVTSTDALRMELEEYSKLFSKVDIDINIGNDEFAGKVTVDVDGIIRHLARYPDLSVNIHIMADLPLKVIDAFKKSDLLNMRKGDVKFLIHQESKFQEALDKYPELDFGITVKAESKMRDFKFYNQFNEVQLMTIITGDQGNAFIPEILDRVEYLREIGFEKTISLDGSVNLETAQLIRDYDVDRVSVGSYFSKSNDLELDLQKLELALNMGS